jgi:two-component system, OmpR family, osmolarity sensor histidine kinase EnvZ
VRRTSIAFRLIFIVATGLIVVQLVATSAFYLQRSRDTQTGFRFPLPDQVSAIVELLETAPPEAHSQLLRAVNAPDLRVAVVAQPPAADVSGAGVRRMPVLEDTVRRYLDALGPRDVRAMIARPDNDDGDVAVRFDERDLWSAYPLRFVIGLKSGEYVVIETRSGIARRMYGWPLGLIASALALVIAAASAYGVWRETKPLGRLAAAAEQFGRTDAQPVPLAESGARELRALIGAFNRMQQRVWELMRGRTLMLGAISHDLRTYLTRLRLRAEFIGDANQRERAVRDVDAMVAMVDDTLAFIRTEARPDLTETVDIGDLVHTEWEARHGQGSAVSLLPAPDEDLFVSGSRMAIERVLAKIVDNALKYGKEAAIELVAAPATVEVRVHDRGPGIPAAERERVFEPFYRLDESRNLKTGGTGLGLAISQQIIQRHDGRILLEDRPGGGLTVRLVLPRCAPDGAAMAQPATPAKRRAKRG